VRRLGLSVTIVAASAAYVGWVEAGRDGRPPRPADRLTLGSEDTGPATVAASHEVATLATAPPALAPAAAGRPADGLQDGFYAGQAYYVTYGIVQVRITISGGKVVALDTPYYPNDRYVSAQISYNVLPLLQTEVVQGQQTDVDIISGATLTVTGYRLSLLDALRQARQAGG
jgi:uncharacterized protein with FMN-binding domain